MYAETVSGNPSVYQGCGVELAEGKDATVAYLDRLHQESLEIIGSLSPEQVQGKCLTPAGTPITTWKWLRAMVEHEIHHRGQLYMYLSFFEIKAPPLFGLTAEEVEEIGRKK